MKCADLQRKISSFIDGELAEACVADLRIHLEQCVECRTWYERLVSLDDDLNASPLFRPDAALAQKVKDRIVSQASSSGIDRSVHSFWWPAAALAVVVFVAVGVGNLAGRSLSKMVASGAAEQRLDFLIPENGQSAADVLLEIGNEEGS